MTYAPPNTAIHFARNEGWSLAERLAAMLVDNSNALVWLKTEDATKPPELQQHRPKPTMWPGRKLPEPPPVEEKLTVDSYLRLVGYSADWGEGDT